MAHIGLNFSPPLGDLDGQLVGAVRVVSYTSTDETISTYHKLLLTIKETIMALVQMLLQRLKEPSTMAGLGSIMAAIGISLPGETLTNITVIIGAAAGILATMLKERGGE